MKEKIKEAFQYFNWLKALFAVCTCVALAVFSIGLVFALATMCAWWLLLWIIPVIYLGILAGLSEVDF